MSRILVPLVILASSYLCLSYQRVFSSRNVLSSRRLLANLDVERIESQKSNLISIARSFATTNLGVSDPSQLADDFICSGPSFNGIEKSPYLSGLTKETAVFQRAMPDFNLRPFSFSVDETQPDVVWFKIRPKGTLTGTFSYKGEDYLPNQKEVELPAQQLSVTIRSGQITRVTAGYTIDRFTGNTGGLAGPSGILYALGEAPSKFDYIPPAVVVRQFFSRTIKPVQRKVVKVSPFPLAVMTSLAKRVVETSLGAEEPSLLASEYQFSGPLVGPLGKDDFVKALKSFNLKSPFPDLRTTSYSFEVDSYDPERVWVISRGSGTQTGPLVLGGKEVLAPSGNVYEGAPEAVSVSFNEQGLCYKATAGYILDKEQGNTKGLGGVFGIFEAIGSPLPWWESRTISEVPGLIKESLFPSSAPVKVSPPIPAPRKSADQIVKSSAPAPVPAPAVSRPVESKTPSPPAIKATLQVEQKVSTPVSVRVETNVPVAPPAVAAKSPSPKPRAPATQNGFFSFLTTQMPAKQAAPLSAASSESVAPVLPVPVLGPKTASPKKLSVAPTPTPKATVLKISPKETIAPVNEPILKAVAVEKPKVSRELFMKSPAPAKKVIAVPVAEVIPKPEIVEKPKAKGMFSMEISKGSTGRLTTGASKVKGQEIKPKI